MSSLSNFVCTFPSVCTSKEHPSKHNLRHNITKINNSFKLLSRENYTNQHNDIIQNGMVRCGISQQAETENKIKLELNQGAMFDGVKYRQTYVIRSTEVDPNKTATFESLTNLLQETGLNHVAMMGVFEDEYGATHEMMRSDLIWVVSKMQFEVHQYPKWGEKIDFETWYAPSTKNSIQRESLIRSSANGVILAQANSTWVLMSRTTRRLSKISETLRCEISPLMIDNPTILPISEKIEKLDIHTAQHLVSNLKPRSSDLDANNHVNNAKYIRWIFEAIPDIVLKTYQLSSILVEYRKECGATDMVESLCSPYDDGVPRDEFDEGKLRYTHLLQIKGEIRNLEILRGRTTWKKKNFATNSFEI